jgi:hypothetical protein
VTTLLTLFTGLLGRQIDVHTNFRHAGRPRWDEAGDVAHYLIAGRLQQFDQFSRAFGRHGKGMVGSCHGAGRALT